MNQLREPRLPFPGSENFTHSQVVQLTYALGQTKEMLPLAVRAISERTGVGGWLPNGFGDTQGLARIEAATKGRARAMIALETLSVLDRNLEPDAMAGVLGIVNDGSTLLEEIPNRVRAFIIQSEKST